MTEQQRLDSHHGRQENWLQWGPYLSERQWGTVREDYSADGNAWDYLPHEHARSRTYRWGEDGLAGISDDEQRLCFALTLWNGRDAFLKERLFGLGNHQGNHGEDVKELYYYLDNTPTHSYQRLLYKYPQAAFPYDELLTQNQSRTLADPEFELMDTGVFDNDRYFDVVAEYVKSEPTDLLIRLTVHNRSAEEASLHLLPTLWFRNSWAGDPKAVRPVLTRQPPAPNQLFQTVQAHHETLGDYTLYFPTPEALLFTENESNTERLFGHPSPHGALVKDAFHAVVTEAAATHASLTAPTGTKCAPVYRLTLPPGGTGELHLRLSQRADLSQPLDEAFIRVLAERQQQADAFYAPLLPADNPPLATVKRQAWAGVLWSKQFYYYHVARWLDGDPGLPRPPAGRAQGRNANWRHLQAHDILLMPDKWEYPWYAAWDLAFQCLALAPVDLALAKQQCLLLTSSGRYYTPDGEIPTYEYNFSGHNPAVRGHSVWLLYDFERRTTGRTDRDFLRRAFEQLQPNYQWWLRHHLHQPEQGVQGSPMGLDNASLLNREAVPGNGQLQQADTLAWLAGYTVYLMRMALELALEEPAYELRAIELFQHFVTVSHALADLNATWQADQALRDTGFYYDVLVLPNGQRIPVVMRSIMGLMPLVADLLVDAELLQRLPIFERAIHAHVAAHEGADSVVLSAPDQQHWLFSLVPHARLKQLLPYLFDEAELLAPSGIRSLSRVHLTQPARLEVAGQVFEARYAAGEADAEIAGGNSNWRGPVWLPLNFLLVIALRERARFYGAAAPPVELPLGSGNWQPLGVAAQSLAQRLLSPFLPDAQGHRPLHGAEARYATDPHFRDLLLFYEYFDGDTSRGCGASHQTGWTALVTLLDYLAK